MIKLYKLNEAVMLMNQNVDIRLDDLMTQWSSRRYGQLAVLLACLRLTYFVHQQNHWIVSGQTSFQDHLLFQRLYETIVGEIDTVAEKCVGVGDTSLVNLDLQLKTVYQMLKNFSATSTITVGPADVVQKSLSVEYTFLKLCDIVRSSLDSQGLLTSGVDNMIAGIYDVHESHIYLLKQRG